MNEPPDPSDVDAVICEIAKLFEVEEHGCVTPTPFVGGFFDDVASVAKSAFSAAKGAAKGVYSQAASFVHHPPGWFVAAMPLFTMENQRYWAKKLGGSTGEQLYDASVKAIASKYLGPQGPQLVEAYNKVADDAAKGHGDAKEILKHAPQIAKLAAASRRGPEAFHAAVVETGSAVKVSGTVGTMYNGGLPKGAQMSNQTDLDQVAAEALEGYRGVAIQAVTDLRHQAPVFGYLHRDLQQCIYPFPSVQDAQVWFDQRNQLEADHDYAAVFSDEDLRSPLVEDLGNSAQIGHWFGPLALGLPAGALGGYFYRKWQESHPGQIIPAIPGISGNGSPSVGGPWVDIVGSAADQGVGAWPWYTIQDVGPPRFVQHGPWINIVGAEAGDGTRRRTWQTMALIKSATREVLDAQRAYPGARAYVWSLEAPSPSLRPGVVLEPITEIVPFSSYDQAHAYMRDRRYTDYVALALFDTTSPRWPNPVTWTKSDSPVYETAVAQQVAKYAPASRTAGEVVGGGPWHSIVGSYPWYTIVGEALSTLRRQARAAVDGLPGRVIGTVCDTKNHWTIKQFRSSDEADAWFDHVKHEPSLFMYAAYFDKEDPMYPNPLNEEIGGPRVSRLPGAPIHRGIAEVTP